MENPTLTIILYEVSRENDRGVRPSPYGTRVKSRRLGRQHTVFIGMVMQALSPTSSLSPSSAHSSSRADGSNASEAIRVSFLISSAKQKRITRSNVRATANARWAEHRTEHVINVVLTLHANI